MLDAAFQVFDRRLSQDIAAPIGVAFSGGRDSLLALQATRAWAERKGRRVIAFHVDHRLQAASTAWSLSARAAADHLDADFVGMSWEGDKPQTGVAAAARRARHRLIAEAARNAGARVVVLGHTADDRIEAGLMRSAGLRIGDLREWSPSPVWPEGRGVFCLRPLLAVRRAAIREVLASQGETWIDDPMNEDSRSPRARVRPAAGAAPDPCGSADDGALARLAAQARVGAGGQITIARAALRATDQATARRLVGAACVCAGGAGGPGRSDRLEAMTVRLLGQDTVTGTLSGAKVIAAEAVLFVRDAGEAARGGLAPLKLAPGQSGVWDGRFEVSARAEPVLITKLAGHAGSLERAQQRQLKSLPAPVRSGLPLMLGEGAPGCPILAKEPGVEVRLLVAERFAAACGVISKEPAT